MTVLFFIQGTLGHLLKVSTSGVNHHRQWQGDEHHTLGISMISSDSGFSIASVLFLWCAEIYGKAYAKDALPYKGAFQHPGGGTRPPEGFSIYLPFAFLTTFIVPVLYVYYLTVYYRDPQGIAIIGSIVGYVIVFAVQIALETKLFNRKQMTSSVPFTFGLYRFWQLSRTLWLEYLRIHRTDGVTAAETPTLVVLLCLVSFWIYDHGVTSIILPWMLNVQLLSEQDMRKVRSSDAKVQHVYGKTGQE